MKLRLLFLTSLAIALSACGEKAANESTDTAAAPEAAAVTSPEAVGLPRTGSAEGASVFFITPQDGSAVGSSIHVEFGIAGMEVVKAGDNQPNSGHHHLLIDTGLPDVNLPIPADEHHIHFGDGSTVTDISLAPGQHTLQMLLGDYLHIPHEPPLVSEVITITVE
jgi:hypothetical protein